MPPPPLPDRTVHPWTPQSKTYSPAEKARVASLCGILGFLLIFFALWMLNLWGEARVILMGSHADGQVVLLERARRSPHDPIVRFRSADGREIEFRSDSVGRAPGPYSRDQRVPVRYIATDPTVAYVANFAGLYGHVVYQVGLAVVFLSGGVALLWARRRLVTTVALSNIPRRPLSLTQCAIWSLGIAAVFWVSIVVTDRMFPPARVSREQVEQARGSAAALLASVETPPGARPYSPSIEDFYGGVDASATLEQNFEAPGRFEDIKGWYRQQLEPKGWRIFNPAETTAGSMEWCKAPWTFRIWRHYEDDGASPTQHFEVRVEWRPRFTMELCVSSGRR